MTHPLQIKGRTTAGACSAVAAFSAVLIAGPAWAQMVNSTNTVRRGHDLAAVACANCHQVAIDQRSAPLLVPPAPSFDSIAHRPDINADALEHFISSTRRNMEHPTEMPNPYLLEYQVQQVVTYILSLRK
jgi:mono/diheme cytochrome c family protein